LYDESVQPRNIFVSCWPKCLRLSKSFAALCTFNARGLAVEETDPHRHLQLSRCVDTAPYCRLNESIVFNSLKLSIVKVSAGLPSMWKRPLSRTLRAHASSSSRYDVYTALTIRSLELWQDIVLDVNSCE
ncbi:hypothetical protein PENTCL1PPCAC_8852, partial [Pristionchus entomophagus]